MSNTPFAAALIGWFTVQLAFVVTALSLLPDAALRAAVA